MCFGLCGKGIHILLEKPMSVSYASCLRMNEACEKTEFFCRWAMCSAIFPRTGPPAR